MPQDKTREEKKEDTDSPPPPSSQPARKRAKAAVVVGAEIDSRFEQLYREIEETLQLPTAFNGSRIHAWLKAEADPLLDILPTIQRLNDEALRKGNRVTSLTYFDKAIARAHAE